MKGDCMKKRYFLLVIFLLSVMTLSSAQNESRVSPVSTASLFKENTDNINVNADGKTIQECATVLKARSENEETLLDETCPFCNIGHFTFVKSSTGIELLDHDEKCSHHPYGSDFIYLTPKYSSFKCTYCGQGANATTTLRRVECGGRSQ